MGKDDDDAWRAIVDNYGDRAELDDPEPEPTTGPDRTDDRLDDRLDDRVGPGRDARTGLPPSDDARTWDDPDSDWSTDRFVPPPPPPLPRTTPDRTAAWAGVLGSPAVLLACLVLGISLPELLAYALVAAFVGGFLYLVVTMSREPRDPDDDGAVL